MKYRYFIGSLIVALLLSSCSKDLPNIYGRELTNEESQSFEQTAITFSDKINNFKPIPGDQPLPEEYSDRNKPPIDWFVEKSNAEIALGRTSAAIKTLEQSLSYYQNSSVSWINLGNIYYRLQDCENAEKYFKKILDTFGDVGLPYIEQSAKCYMNKGDKNKVRELMDLYTNKGGTTIDPEIQNYLQNN